MSPAAFLRASLSGLALRELSGLKKGRKFISNKPLDFKPMAQHGRKSAASLETLSVIEPTRRNRRRPAPDHLSDEMKAWWAEVTSAFDLNSHHLRLLQLCCESLDRVKEARAILAVEGLMYTDGHGNPRAHPATIIERDNKIAAGRLIKELHLDPPPDKKPGGIGWMPPEVRRPWDR
jgi:P27 family predicted phage terminase small subunit